MVRVKNLDPGILSIDPPNDKRDVDNVAALLTRVGAGDLSSSADVQRVLLELELAKHKDALVLRQIQADAARRAGDTIDLIPAYQGKGKPQHVNEIEDGVWARLEKMPAIAARIAAGRLIVTGAGKGKTRATRSKETQASA